MTVAAILHSKGKRVVTIRPDATIGAAVTRLRMENIGCLVVSETGDDVCGIISERDIVLSIPSHASDLHARTVAEIMTRSVHTCSPEDKLSAIMTTMTRFRIRHLPVKQDGKLAGIISIGDVVKRRLEELELERNVMRDYISAY